MDDVIVIGSGPAGLNAALYAARANLGTKVLTGPQLGGQVSLTWQIDNYLGLHEDVSGAELVSRMVKHVEKFGVELVYDEVTGVDFSGRPLKVKTYAEELEASAVVLATGASVRRLGVPGEDEFLGRGVSYCATCDGAFFKDQDVAVVGGGDSALDEAIFLTRFARSVRVIHRRDELRAGPGLQQRAMNNEKISFVWNTVVDEIAGDGKVERLTVRRTDTDEVGQLGATGVFIFIGRYPSSGVFKDAVELDERGYVRTDERARTSVPGVFAAGEVMDPVWRQVATSVGQGCMAGISAEHYLSELNL